MRYLIFALLIFVGCTSEQVNIAGDVPFCSLGFTSYSLEFHGDSTMYIVKNGGGEVFFDRAFFMVDGKTREFQASARMGYRARIDIDRKFIADLAGANFVSWRPSNYTNAHYNFTGEHFRRLQEYGEYFK